MNLMDLAEILEKVFLPYLINGKRTILAERKIVYSGYYHKID